MDWKSYFTALAQETGVSPEEAQVLLKVAENEKSSKKLQADWVERSTFSSELDKKDKEHTKLKGEVAEYYKTESAKAAKNQEIVQRYIDTYGPLDGSNPPARDGAPDLSKYISKEDYDKEIRRIESQSLYVTKEGIKAATDYLHRFGKPLDIDGLEKFAIEKQLPINLAYQQFIAPEVQAKEATSWEEKLKLAKEEGAREALSRVKVPLDNGPKEVHPFFHAKELQDAKTVPSSAQVRDSFVSAWQEANAGGVTK